REAVWRDEPSERIRDQFSIRALVEDIRGDDAVEHPDVVRDVTPIEEPRSDIATCVCVHVHAREIQRVLVVVGRDDVEPGHGRCRRYETGAAPELDERPARALLFENPRREYA